MKFLIAGLGSIGRRHFRNLVAHGQRDIVLYRTHQSTLPDDELAGFPVETDLQAALAHQPDGVIVSNPTALHLAVAVPAARAGAHLLLEKPINHSLAGVGDLQAAVEAQQVRTLVGFQFRYHPGLLAVREWLRDGQIGRPISFRAHWGEYLPAWHPWEDYRDSYAARPDLGGGVDTAEIGLQFTNGVIGSVHVNYNQRPPRHDLEIVGTEGTITWDNADGAAHAFLAGPSEMRGGSPPEGFDRNHLFMDEIANFMAVIRNEEAPACSLEDGVQALRLVLAALESAQSGRIIRMAEFQGI
jgi:predicted dehydrogenase